MTEAGGNGGAKAGFWLVCAVAFIWNGLGCVNLIQQMSASGLETLPAEYQALIETRPVWGLLGFALSVICGLIGEVLLFLRL